MTTGSYEGSLSMEGIPGHHEAASFTSRCRGWSRRSSESSDPHAEAKSQRARPACSSREGGRGVRRRESATGVPEARSRQHRGKKTPALVTQAVRPKGARTCARHSICRSGLGCRETPIPPVLPYGAQDSVGCPRRESGDQNRERTRCGYTQFDWVAEVGWTHRASSSPGGRKTCW
jgi:hypothetical protein